MTKTLAVLALLSFGAAAHADGLRYNQRVYVNGQQGRVISQGTNQTHRVVVETHNAAGRSTGTTTLNGYNLAFNRQLKPGTPSYVGLVRNMNDLNRLRHRGF